MQRGLMYAVVGRGWLDIKNCAFYGWSALNCLLFNLNLFAWGANTQVRIEMAEQKQWNVERRASSVEMVGRWC